MPSRRQIEAGHAYIMIEALDKTQAVFKTVGRKLSALGDHFVGVGRRAAFLAGALILPFGGAIREAKNFSDEILYLQSVLGATDEQMTPLIRKIKELTNTSTYLALDIAKAATELAQGGFSKSQIADSLQAVLDMARGARMELGATAKVMVDTLTLFNMKADEASSVADKFFVAAKNGTIDVADLAQSFSYAALSANEMGFTLDETLGILSAISLRMLKATKAGTSLNQFFTSLASNADKLREIGVDPFTAQGKAKAGLQILKELSQKMRTMNQEQKISIMEKIFNVRGMRAAMAGAGAALEEIFTGVEEIKNSEGAAAKAASKMDEGIGGALRRIGSAFNMMMVEIGMSLEPTFKMLGETFRPYFNGVITFIRQNQEAVKALALFAVAIAGYAASYLVLGVAIKLLLPFLTIFLRGIQLVTFGAKTVLGSLTLLTKGLTILESGLMLVIRRLGSLMIGLVSAVTSVISFSVSLVVQGIAALAGFAASILTAVIPAILSFASSLAVTAVLAIRNVMGYIASLTVMMTGRFLLAIAMVSKSLFLMAVTSPFALLAIKVLAFIAVMRLTSMVVASVFKALTGSGGMVGTIFKSVFNAVISVLKLLGTYLLNAGKILLDLVGIGWTFAKAISPAFIWISKQLLYAFTLAGKAIFKVFDFMFFGLFSNTTSLFGSISSWVVTKAKSIWGAVSGFTKSAIFWGGELFAFLKDGFSSIPSLVQSAFGPVVGYLKQIGPAFQEIIGGFAPAFQGTFNGLYDIAKTSIGLILEAIKMGDFEGAWNIAVSGFTGIWKVLLGNLKIQWVNFIAEFKSLFFSAIAAITSAWRTSINNLAKGFLESAASNKIVNALLKLGSGIDIQAEIQKGKEQNAKARALGLPDTQSPLDLITTAMDTTAQEANQQTTRQLADDLKKIHEQMASDIKAIEEDRNKATKEFNDKAAKDTDSIMWRQIQAAAMGSVMIPSGPNQERKGPLLTDSGAPPFVDTQEIKVTSPPATLMKGTAEAAKQAWENTQVNQKIDEERKQTKILKDIADNTAAAAFFADRPEDPNTIFVL